MTSIMRIKIPAWNWLLINLLLFALGFWIAVGWLIYRLMF